MIPVRARLLAWVADLQWLGGKSKRQGSMFFFEKKNQKTFASCASN
jgi:hypothetical protein